VAKAKTFAKGQAKNASGKFDFSRDPDAPGAVEQAWRDAFNAEYVKQRETGTDSGPALKTAKKVADAKATEVAKARAASPLNLETARARARADVADGTAFKSDAKLGTDTAAAKKAYDAGTQGQNAKAVSLRLAGKTVAEMQAILDAEAAAGKCGPAVASTLGNGKPQVSYLYNDGTLVRLKPLGDAFGDDPTYSVEVTKQPGGPAGDQGDVAFKVGADGKPVPKGPSDVNNPYDKGTNPDQNKAYETEVMEQGHLKAKLEPPPP
jgi:hypothetical protein